MCGINQKKGKEREGFDQDSFFVQKKNKPHKSNSVKARVILKEYIKINFKNLLNFIENITCSKERGASSKI